MRLLSDLECLKLDNLYARLNDTFSVLMNPNCRFLSKNSKLRKLVHCQLTPQIRAKFLLVPAVIISGILSVCCTALYSEEVNTIKTDDSSVEEVNVYRNPFSLPSGVSFVAKKESVGDLSEYTEWKEGVVASSVNGIFQSGNIVRANINGIWVKEGDWVGEEQVIDIETENVVLIGKEEKEKRNLPLREAETELKVIELIK